jgi:hypothetical protein
MLNLAIVGLCSLVVVFGAPLAANPAASADPGGDPAWSILSPPSLPDSLATILHSVDCVTSTDCIAVGKQLLPGYVLKTVAEHWNGSTWKLLRSPNRPNYEFNFLESVSCVGPEFCIAAGASTKPKAERPLIERWDGTSWTIQPVPFSRKWPDMEPRSVSCTAVDACTAVGIKLFSPSAYPEPFVMRWDGQRWTYHGGEPPSTAGGTLEGISCVAPDTCEATGGHTWQESGSFHGTDFALGWDGERWSYQPQPNPGDLQKVYESRISCSSSAACTAVGEWNASHRFRPLVQRWDGTSWARQQLPNPPGGFVDTELGGISCPSDSACTAVGYWSTTHKDNPAFPLAYGWDGSTWTLQSMRDVPHSKGTYFYSVDCMAPSTCMAVGDYYVKVPGLGEVAYALAEVYG